MIKKQIPQNLHKLEQALLITCIAIILLMAAITLGFWAYIHLFTPLLILDAIVFIKKTRIPETLVRLLLLVNIVAAFASIYFIIGQYAGWLLS